MEACVDCGKRIKRLSVGRCGNCARTWRREHGFFRPGDVGNRQHGYENRIRTGPSVAAVVDLVYVSKKMGVSKQAVDQTERKAMFDLRCLLIPEIEEGDAPSQFRQFYRENPAAVRRRHELEARREAWGGYVDKATFKWWRDTLREIARFRRKGLHEEADEIQAEVDRFRAFHLAASKNHGKTDRVKACG